ncbi:hypothetical protein [Deinococcus sp. DB0503]|uniref:hypothetical protein n=1 Tax=Deinococcus sp. DB0503 TaxID=2479203 RepID=UPI0018DF13D6|nr:hypothetical protein [Deinococcus sp. DB0503]MBI0447246.1 hypothetical protein [Deinococcus sp. DB0503]
MSRTFHACPTCGGSTTNSGPCAACLEKQRNADKFHHTALGLGWLYVAWRARKPLFWFLLLGTAFVGFQVLLFQGHAAAQVWDISEGAATLFFAFLLAASVALKVRERTWSRRVSGKANQKQLWLIINVTLTLTMLCLGLPAIVGGIWLADATLPAQARMVRSGPLWLPVPHPTLEHRLP